MQRQPARATVATAVSHLPRSGRAVPSLSVGAGCLKKKGRGEGAAGPWWWWWWWCDGAKGALRWWTAVEGELEWCPADSRRPDSQPQLQLNGTPPATATQSGARARIGSQPVRPWSAAHPPNSRYHVMVHCERAAGQSGDHIPDQFLGYASLGTGSTAASLHCPARREGGLLTNLVGRQSADAGLEHGMASGRVSDIPYILHRLHL